MHQEGKARWKWAQGSPSEHIRSGEGLAVGAE